MYFVTGATGFVGRHLVERLLTRGGDQEILVLVRAGSLRRLDELEVRWASCGDVGRIRPVLGDLREPGLGLAQADQERLEGVEHVFHLAASYDLTASEAEAIELNVRGTERVVALADALGAQTLHHVSSVAVAGDYDGSFTEDMLDEGQSMPHPYHATKLAAEQIVRARTRGAWRVYRPSIVVGHSETGEADKVDGPYYFFDAIRRLGKALPSWLPLAGLELGQTNLVPVDYVAAAIDGLAHAPGLDGRAFHLVDPRPQPVGEVINAFAKAAGAPQSRVIIDSRLTALPGALLGSAMRLPGLAQLRRLGLSELGIPEAALEQLSFRPTFDSTATRRALEGSGLAVPALKTYAKRLWEVFDRELAPVVQRDAKLEAAVAGRTVVVTGASSGIGRAAAHKLAAAGAVVVLVARGRGRLEAVREEIERAGGIAHAQQADLADAASIDDLLARLAHEHPVIDVLVNNAGHSIRRSVALSYDRPHDFERLVALNYLGAVRLIMGLMPGMRERGSGHVVNVSSIGVQTSPPRFSAYVASKAALDAWTRVVSSETVGDGVTFTTIHMPLVRTPMIAPTKLYDAFPAISPEEAADMVCTAIRDRPKHIGTRLGTLGEVAYAVAPKAVDRLLHLAYRVFPDSGAARDPSTAPTADPSAAAVESEPSEDRISREMVALAHLTRGVHW